MTAMPGDWIIKGVNGEIYPCKHDIFEKTYELAGDDAPDTPTGWQPIETAPKSINEEILLYAPDYHRGYVIGIWYGGHAAIPKDEEHWKDVRGWCEIEPAPTHWMPLPKPPQIKEDGENDR